jgi:cytochrome P450
MVSTSTILTPFFNLCLSIYGPYHCPGKQFAMQEMRILLATIIRKYDMKLAPGFDAQAFEVSFARREYGLLTRSSIISF